MQRAVVSREFFEFGWIVMKDDGDYQRGFYRESFVAMSRFYGGQQHELYDGERVEEPNDCYYIC